MIDELPPPPPGIALITTATNAESEPLTLEKLKEAAEYIKALGEDPLLVYMRGQGFDPKYGGRMVLPVSLKEYFGPFGAPWYVKFSNLFEEPFLYHAPTFIDPDTL